MDIETINKYIELDNQIKNRIVQISNALRGVRHESISKFVSANIKNCSDLDIRCVDEFIENSKRDDFFAIGQNYILKFLIIQQNVQNARESAPIMTNRNV